ncbi:MULTISPECIES: uracil-DNA glycosylase family protein [unclassified Polaromonas]|uniref:uracil-DNA glycosylase family protein n=1 Tax=unclassified Polaromonas TaxID=2638319 RepID=UPI0018C9C5DF|nr:MULTISPECIES: uracil-DNA glycosylase family protein [unclassified Polaromonas]MBG6073711.1 DNA polymerase [Polaromonas sp. CG_9.7]MBG6115820.1 DNA polymerase [Polaromonas sp. CG_9.2]MDH6183393.1 DNA polymerase [Polaromonas sp. CG_23.6]
MRLNLDTRQRAILQEMGVRVWQPLAEVSPAIEIIAVNAELASAKPGFGQNFQTDRAVLDAAPPPPATRQAATAPQPARAAPPVPPPALAPSGHAFEVSDQPGWRLGPTQQLYAETAQSGGARWLVLAQAPPAALQAPAFEGDAGRLLDNMLRAARLNNDAGAVLFAPLVRQSISGPMDEFLAALAALVEHAQPDVVLVMGRLAAQALLASSEPFGKLRGQPHVLNGCTTVVTHDAPYLLRCPQDKAKAWDDLCLAMGLAASAG